MFGSPHQSHLIKDEIWGVFEGQHLSDIEILVDVHPFNLNISSYVLRGKWIPKYHVFDRCIFYHISIYCPIYNKVEVNVTVHEKCVYDDMLLLKH